MRFKYTISIIRIIRAKWQSVVADSIDRYNHGHHDGTVECRTISTNISQKERRNEYPRPVTPEETESAILIEVYEMELLIMIRVRAKWANPLPITRIHHGSLNEMKNMKNNQLGQQITWHDYMQTQRTCFISLFQQIAIILIRMRRLFHRKTLSYSKKNFVLKYIILGKKMQHIFSVYGVLAGKPFYLSDITYT